MGHLFNPHGDGCRGVIDVSKNLVIALRSVLMDHVPKRHRGKGECAGQRQDILMERQCSAGRVSATWPGLDPSHVNSHAEDWSVCGLSSATVKYRHLQRKPSVIPYYAGVRPGCIMADLAEYGTFMRECRLLGSLSLSMNAGC